MPTAAPVVTEAVLDLICRNGYSLGETATVDVLAGEIRQVVKAVDARTGESVTVSAPDRYTAAAALAEQVGVDLEDGQAADSWFEREGNWWVAVPKRWKIREDSHGQEMGCW